MFALVSEQPNTEDDEWMWYHGGGLSANSSQLERYRRAGLVE